MDMTVRSDYDYWPVAFIKSNQSKHIYIAPRLCRRRIRGAEWQRLGRVFTFTFTIGNVKQLGVRLKVLRSSADRQLYDREFQIQGALRLDVFADNASVILGTKSNSLSDDRSVRASW